MSHISSSMFSLPEFDPPLQFPDSLPWLWPDGDPGRDSLDTGLEDFFLVDDNNSNDEAQLVLLEELLSGSDPDPGAFVESIDFDSDPIYTAIVDVLLEDLLPDQDGEEPWWEDRAARGGVSDMEIDGLLDPLDWTGLYLPEEDPLVLDSDYAELLDQLLGDEDGEGRRGSAPAANRVVVNLPLVELGKEDLELGGRVCAVCTDDCKEGEVLNRLPCCHYFHRNCILPWLRIRSTCPVCRFALPSNDEECLPSNDEEC